MGFITLHEMEAFDIVTHKNYREVGLEVVNGQWVGSFNACWKVWHPNLGLGSTMGLVIYSLSAYLFLLHSMENTTYMIMKGMVTFGFRRIVVCRSLFYDS